MADRDFTFLEEERAPIPRAYGSSNRARQAYFEAFLTKLSPGVAGKIRLTGENGAVSVGRSVHEAAKRLGLSVQTWNDDEFYYVSLRQS